MRHLPKHTIPSQGGLMNPRWPYTRTNNILENFRYERETARREAQAKQQPKN